MHHVLLAIKLSLLQINTNTNHSLRQSRVRVSRHALRAHHFARAICDREKPLSVTV